MRKLWLVVLVLAGGLQAGQAGEPVRLIFDTDMGNDVDDALALGMIHSLQSRGVCELLAVTVTKDERLSAPYVDLVNTFYGRGEIPIGVVKEGPTRGKSKFTVLADEKEGSGFRYPHDLTDGSTAPDATALLRKTLAAQPDGSVILVQVGFSTNVARLLNSPGDEHSSLTGVELVKKKVKWMSLMAGAFTPIRGNKRYLEYNVKVDVPAAKVVAEKSPVPIVYSGFEIGIAVPYPHESIEQDYNYVMHHPLAEAYRLYNPPPHDRPTWDLTSVLYAVFPERGYFSLSPAGTVTVEDDGFTRFVAAEGGMHRYLKLTAEQKIRVIEALVQLSSQPPQRLPGNSSESATDE